MSNWLNSVTIHLLVKLEGDAQHKWKKLPYNLKNWYRTEKDGKVLN